MCVFLLFANRVCSLGTSKLKLDLRLPWSWPPHSVMQPASPPLMALLKGKKKELALALNGLIFCVCFTVLQSKNQVHRRGEYNVYSTFQSHEPEFDYLKSLEIEEKINKIRWLPQQNAAYFLLSTNGMWRWFSFSCLTFSETVNQTCESLLALMFLQPLWACEKLRNPVCKMPRKIHGAHRVELSK